MLTREKIRDSVVELLLEAETSLPKDVENALKKAYKAEYSDIARTQLKAILDNVALAGKKKVPMCQDTGVPVFFVGLGSKAKVDIGLVTDAIIEGVKVASKEIPLRPNIVHPLTRKNTGDNTGLGVPVIEFEVLDGKDYLEITVLPKGAGSENMSALRMLNPSEGIVGIKKFVLDTVAAAGSNPCPPTIVGVGIGGTADRAMLLSKRALLRPLGSSNSDTVMAKLEKELLGDINRLGIGPMGLGGKTTSLGVNVEYCFCHTASLPVAVNIQCWANRKASVRIR
jgi:fumarate hydratase subunit alpha